MTLTSLYGYRKYGAVLYGATSLSQSRYGLEVDWDGDGLFDGQNEGTNLQDLSIERGRRYTVSSEGDAFEEEETGRFSATLLDTERRYDPYNSSSPLFGMLTGGKFFRVKVRTPGDSVLPLMAGVIDEPVSYTERGVGMARLVGTDGWSFLRQQRQEVTIPLQESIYAQNAIARVLTEAQWPSTWASDLGAGVDQRPYFWVDQQSAAQVIHELAHNELGTICMAATGALKFRSRNNLEGEVLTLTDLDVMNVQRMSPAEVIRNVIRVKSSPRKELATQVVWEIPGRIEIQAGETLTDIWAEFTYNDVVVPVRSPITPVATTDYDAKANEDGSGADSTANFSVWMYPFGTRAQLTITNNGAAAAWIYVRVRGNPLKLVNNVAFTYRDVNSIRQFGPRPFTLTIDQNVNIARQYRDLLASFMTQSRNYLIVDLMPEPEVQFSVDLGQIIRAQLANYGIDGAYRLIRIQHQFHDANGIVVMTRWWLEPFVRLFTGVQLPVQLPFQLGTP